MALDILLTFLGWQFLPTVLTRTIVRTLDNNQAVLPSSLWEHSASRPGQAVKNQRLVRTFVILVYLAYTIYSGVIANAGPNWYDVLGVDRNVDETGLKVAARQAARLYHPDKAGPEGEFMFRVSREAYEALSSPEKRFAYERFGPKILTWSKCITTRDYMIQGLESTLIWYAMTAAVQLAMHYFSSSARQGQTTRIYLFFALFAAELSLLFSPRSRTFFDLVFPSRCIYQHVALLQQLWITASLAINQIVPLWSTGTTETTTVRDPKAEEQLQLLLERSIIMAREMEMNDAKGMQEDVQSLVQQGTKQGLPEQVVKGLTKKEIEENTIDVLLSRLPPNSKGRITTLGMFIIDTFSFLTDSGDPVASDARKEKQPQIGGGGTYFIIGARIFLPPSRLGQIIHYTPETCPEWMLEDLKSYEVDDMSEDVDQQGNGCQPEGKPQGMFQFTLRPDGLGTTTAENIYRGEARDFKFLTPGYRMWPRDLVDSSFFSNDHGQGNSGVDGAQSKSSVGSSTISTNSNTPSTSPPSMVHFTAFPGRAKEILDQLDEIAASDGKGNGWRPDTIYEIFPSECTPPNLPLITTLLPRLTILSPNHVEALSLFGVIDSPFTSDEELAELFTEERLKSQIEEVTRKLVEMLCTQQSDRGGKKEESLYSVNGNQRGIVIRCGHLGAIVGHQKQPNGPVELKWIDAFWDPSYQTTAQEHLVDVTGGGNAFLGGLAAGLDLTNGDLIQAALYGSVAASFAIEQEGLPKVSRIKLPEGGVRELWNGQDPMERVKEMVTRKRIPTEPVPSRPRSLRHQVLVCGDDSHAAQRDQLVKQVKLVLTPYYTVQPISIKDVYTQPWTTNAALAILLDPPLDNDKLEERIASFIKEGGSIIRVNPADATSTLEITFEGSQQFWPTSKVQAVLSDVTGQSLREAMIASGLHPPPLNDSANSVWKGMPRSLLRPKHPLPLFLVGHQDLGSDVGDLVFRGPAIAEKIEPQSIGKKFVDANDTLLLLPASKVVGGAVAFMAKQRNLEDAPDASTIILPEGPVTRTSTPLFNFARYFELLSVARAAAGRIDGPRDGKWGLGDLILYGEAVTSTQTMLDKNPVLLQNLPTPWVSMASFQLSGRGRGTNQWLSPPGCLQFSILAELPASFPPSKLVFAQYLAALAICQGLDDDGKIGVRIKWPNDMYAETYDVGDAKDGKKGRAKIGGILVNSSFANGKWRLVIGCGVNILNEAPTTSFEQMVNIRNSRLEKNQQLALPTMEDSFAKIMVAFDGLWEQFVEERTFAPFIDEYLGRWLHTDQKVTLTTTTPPTELIIKSITLDQGLLRCEKVRQQQWLPSPLERFESSAYDPGSEDRTGGGYGRLGSGSSKKTDYIDLQPDGNSFDMMAGLLRKKL